MDQILYVNSASFEVLGITGLLLSGTGSDIDFSLSTQVSGSFVGSLVGTASYALVTDTAISASHALISDATVSASYALSASVANATTSASYATTASFVQTAQTAQTASYHAGQRIKMGIAQGAWFAGNPKKYTVNFTSSFANTNYVINVNGQVARTFLIEAQTTSSFVINSNGNQAFTGPVYWLAAIVGEF
jgi:hypothetical protein